MKERFSEVSQRKLDVSACHVLLHITFAVILGLQVANKVTLISLKFPNKKIEPLVHLNINKLTNYYNHILL